MIPAFRNILASCGLVVAMAGGLLLPARAAADVPVKAAPATATLDISSQVDRSEITIGDRIQYEIKVVYPADGQVILPSVLGNLGAFEVKDYQVSDPKPAGNLKIQTWRFNLSTFTVGKYTLPPQQLAYRHGTDTTAVNYFTQPIEINVVRTSPETIKDIADIAPLAEVRGGRPWLAYGLGGLALLILGLLLWKRLHRRRTVAEKVIPQLPPFEEAMEKLGQLKNLALIRQNRAREFCFILSELLRRYISRRFGIDALESTTAEFIESSKKLPITSAQKDWLVKFCDGTDLVKYADAPLLESEAQNLLSQTEEFLRQTKPREATAASAATPLSKPAGAGKPANPAKPSDAGKPNGGKP